IIIISPRTQVPLRHAVSIARSPFPKGFSLMHRHSKAFLAVRQADLPRVSIAGHLPPRRTGEQATGSSQRGPAAEGNMQSVYRLSGFSHARPLATVHKISDEALLESIAAGSKSAMRVLFGRHHVRVYRFALRLAGNAALAEDIVGEVFMDVWR